MRHHPLWIFSLVFSPMVALAMVAQAKPQAPAGDEQPAVAQADADRVHEQFYDQLRARCQSRWTQNFVAMAAARLPADHPVNDSTRVATVALTLAKNGSLVDARLALPSGVEDLDHAVLDVVKDAAPFPAPPAMLSDDGHVHLRWVFKRQDGRCDQIQATYNRLPPAEAVPALMAQGREDDALARLAEATGEEATQAGRAFAFQWLKRRMKDPVLGPRAVAAVAVAGDKQAQALLQAMAQQGRGPDLVWPALARAGLPVCPHVKVALADKTGLHRPAALQALGLAPADACAEDLVRLATDRVQPRGDRVLAVKALALIDDPQARAAVAALKDDGDVWVRAAALWGWARPGGGKKELFALTPLLRDPSPLIRAAALAGLVRSQGDRALEQIYLLFKETDPSVYQAVAEELSALDTAGSAAFLTRFLRKSDARIRLAAAWALARRTDVHAHAVLAKLGDDADPAVRTIAARALTADQRETLRASWLAAGPARAQVHAELVAAGASEDAARVLAAHFPGTDARVRADMLAVWLDVEAVRPARMAASR